MCGIAGFSFTKPDKNFSKKFFKIKEFINHRGPDSSGYFKNQYLNLIHTRLSIVDLKRGNQPFINSKYVLVANGEIYNDLEIRREYKSYNYTSNSDCESILAVYSKHGIPGLRKLRGMYAFAIYDKSKDEIIIGRDEFGIKPLYFSLVDKGFVFCSEIEPINSLKLRKKKINNEKIWEFFQLQYCCGASTIYKDIYKISQGQILVIKRGKIIKSFSNSLPKKKEKSVFNNFSYIDKHLKESISSHLRSDVPYCLFFSGGIDSMILLHYMIKLKKKVSAYSIFFQDKENKFYDEIANSYNIDLKKINFSEDDFWKWIMFAAHKIDDPIADYAVLPTFKLASIASENFKVAITGEGGDEIFGGYGRYKKTQRLFFRNQNFIPKGCFNQNKFKKFINWDYELKQINNYINSKDLSLLQRFQIFDYYNWLPNNLLVKLDRCLMTFGMEGRTPFIDKVLFKKMFFFKDKEKINKGLGKFYIRKFLKSKVPSYDSFAKKKGFSVPIYDWIPKKVDQLEELILKLDFLDYYFSREELKYLFNSLRKNKKIAKPVWHIIFFISWYLINIKKFKKKGNFFEVLSSYK